MLLFFNLVNILGSLCITLELAVIRVQDRSSTSRIDNARNCNYKENKYPCGDGLCTCCEQHADCIGHRGKKLRYIPKLPNITTSLLLEDNHLPVINATTFENISHQTLQLEQLFLCNNEVRNISKSTFTNLIFLKELSLIQERKLNLDELKTAFSSISKSTIETISVNGMEWYIVDQQFFGYLNHSDLAKIDLSVNQLREINFKVFSGLKYISSIILSKNNLKKLEMYALAKLQSLNVSSNRISLIPSFCDYNLQTNYFPTLKRLDLSYNKIIDVTRITFNCVPELEVLNLRKNPFGGKIEANFISTLRFLLYLDLSYPSSKYTTQFRCYTFNSTSLRQLHLNGFHDSLAPEVIKCPQLVFKYCTNLAYLSLSNTTLSDRSSELNALFAHISRIQYLDLGFTGLTVLPEESFSHMTSLKVLHLDGNYIRSWNGPKFFGNSKLSYLSMRRNQISSLNSTSLPSSLMKYLNRKSLNLSENPYLCTCQTIESINWLRRHETLLANYPAGYDCFSPPETSRTRLIDYNPSADSCTGKNVPLLVSVPVSIIAITTMSVIFVVYRCRWCLRYGLNLFSNRTKTHDRFEDFHGLKFAGFVIYSDADRNWVHNELIQKLEVREGFRLCIRLRDFDVGKVHVDNIVDNMWLSSKIILILSNNFAQDEWCHFQLLLAETRLLKQNTNMLVVFILGEIRIDCLRKSIYKLVTERQFILLTTDETGNELFWKQAVSQMKKSTTLNYGTIT